MFTTWRARSKHVRPTGIIRGRSNMMTGFLGQLELLLPIAHLYQALRHSAV